MRRIVFLVMLVLGFTSICSPAKADFYVIAAGGRLIGTEIRSLPYTITSPGFYYIKQNLTSIGDGIIVESDDVTIDLMGYSLIGQGSGSDSGIYMRDRRNVEIRNGTIKEFGSHGIYETDNTGKAHHRIISVRSLSNGDSGIFLNGSGHLVKDCTVAENGSFGIYVLNGSTVTGNTASHNQDHGIVAYTGCTVTVNTTYNNQGIGISVVYGGSVITNTAYLNQRSGIRATNGSTVTGNTVRSNNQSNNADYTGIWAGTGCLVKNNNVTSNEQNNIYVYGSKNSIEENLVTYSNNGIYFRIIGNFYANNRASGNSTNYNDVPGNQNGGGNVEF